MMWSVRVLGGLQLANVRVPNPRPALCIAGVFTFALAVLTSRRQKPLAIAGLAAIAASAALIVLAPAQPAIHRGVLEVTSIDVGQAESTLVITPEGKSVLVDAGGSLGPFQSEFDFGEEVVSPYLWSRGFSHVDALALTHAHSDHLGGMRALIGNFHPREFWVGPNADVRDLRDLLTFAHEHGVHVIRREGDDVWQFGGATFHALSPPRGWQPGDKVKNNDSLVVKISYGSNSVLLTGDAEKQVEALMAEKDVHADVLKLGHNGSKTSSTPEFLAAVHPRFAFISVGARNSFGHPKHEVLERVAAAHVRTYRTDTAGAITFYLDGKNVTVRPWLEAR
jgi:competence protein ComEC